MSEDDRSKEPLESECIIRVPYAAMHVCKAVLQLSGYSLKQIGMYILRVKLGERSSDELVNCLSGFHIQCELLQLINNTKL